MKLKQIYFPEKHNLDVAESELSPLKPNEVLIKNKFSIISPGTELAMYTKTHVGFNDPNNHYAEYPFYPGYATSGVVEDLGSQVKHLKLGDCVFHRGQHASHHLCDAEAVRRISGEQALRHAVFVPLCLISLTAVRLSSVTMGTNATVIGQGIIGNLAAQLLRASAAHKVFCIDRSEKRLSISNACDLMDTYLDGQASVDEVEQQTEGKKCRVVVEATGVPQCVNNCFSYISDLGELILLGSARGSVEIDPYNSIHRKGIAVIGAHGQFRGHGENPIDVDSTQLILRMLEDQRLIVEPIITTEVDATHMQGAYENLIKKPDEHLGVLVNLDKW